VRVGLAHYNTAEEVDMLLYALDEIRPKPGGVAKLALG
jgi:selenocysteine lyase/cysteine desulfurase